jgi:hypothetical protein
MSDTEAEGDGARAAAGLTPGQLLVASFRAARVNRRPDLRAALKGGRVELRQDRMARLGLSGKAEAPGTPAVAAAPAEAPQAALEAEAASGPSMFAHFVTRADEVESDRVAAIPAQAEPAASAPPDPVAEATVAAPAEPQLAPLPPAPSPAVCALGFGPGMTARFQQIGIETIADLAAADAGHLRSALGDVSRLINIEAWIATAKAGPAEAA